MKHLLAVYGTLKKGYGNHYLLKDSKFLGEFKTLEGFTMYSTGGFPILSNKGNTKITYELYEISNKDILNRIYQLEGYSGIRDDPRNWYNTMDISTPFGDAEIFFIEGPIGNLPIKESGNW